MSAPLTVRPVPIRDAFRTVTGATAFLGSIVVLLVGYGVISTATGSAVEGILGAIPGLVSLVVDLVRSVQVHRAIRESEAAVTPLESPAMVVDGEVVPARLAPIGGSSF